MSMFPQNEARRYELDYATDEKVVFNFFNMVYAWMCVGLAITATVAWLVAQNTQMLRAIHTSGMSLVFLLGSVLAIWGIRAAAARVSANVATALFLIYSAVVGLIFSGIFVVYRMESIGGVFLMTAGVFGGMSFYGFVTKRDLTSIGSICIMAVWGIFLGTIVNIFWANTGLYWIITYVGLAAFIALTAYDTQKLKETAHQLQGNPNAAARMAIIGALSLYLDFINMFLFLLRIFGSRK